MLTSLLLMATVLEATVASAATTEVGNEKTFGIGVQAGSPITVTGKFWMNDKGGIAFHAGTWFGSYVAGRVQFEQQFVQFGDWDFGDVGMYWHAGVAVLYWTLPSIAPELALGPSGGVAGELRFKAVPAAVFVEVGTQVHIIGHNYSWIGYNGGAGGRWYF